jgi:hypothetical protein
MASLFERFTETMIGNAGMVVLVVSVIVIGIFILTRKR